MFHFNKKHLVDPTVPMWVVKTHGITFYVNHVTAELPWSTKETPGNEHTKGSIKFKKCKLTIDSDNCATLSTLRLIDKLLPFPKGEYTRIITRAYSAFHDALEANEFKHSKIKYVEGACSTEFAICDLLDAQEVTLAGLKYANQFRILNASEHYYRLYDGKEQVIQEVYEGEESDYNLDYE